MKKEDFTIRADKGGYMIYYKGKPIGGASTLNNGKSIRGRAATKQSQDYLDSASRAIDSLLSGGGHPFMVQNIKEIDKK